MSSLEIDHGVCPKCGKVFSHVSNADENEGPPRAGDLTICFGCATIFRFKEDLKVEVLQDEEFNELDDESRELLNQLSEIILSYNASKE